MTVDTATRALKICRLAVIVLSLSATVSGVAQEAKSEAAGQAPLRPNIVIVFTDDQGYGDLSCFGSETIRTPRLDQLAREGTRFTSFYAQVVCGPSRSALLTGRYPVRSLGWSMPGSEVTLAELLQQAGYTTGCIGKWDVSNRAAMVERMPNAQGFDFFWGTLGANDNGRVVFHENNRRVGETDDMASLTRLYTDKGIEFLRQNRDRPFFLYVAHTMVHSIIDASPEFKGKSRGGLYGDTVEELDFHTGRLLDVLDELHLRDNTLVIFTTDNGPWHNFQDVLGPRHNGQIAWGSSGPLREGKGSTYEGGIRVPCIARWPQHVPAGRVSDAIFATIDFLPTFGKLAGYEAPADRVIDGVDQTALLSGDSETGARQDYFYFCQGDLHAVRKGKWKLILPERRDFYGYVDDKGSSGIELYDLEADLGEKQNEAEAHPEVVRELLVHATSVPWPDAEYDQRIGLASPAQPKREVPPLPLGDWAAHGFTDEQRDQIRRAFQAGIDNQFIPGGALMLIHKGEIILREALGVADLESKRPFLPSAPCRIASLTKPHTATLLALLAQQGRLSLDEPIDVYLPEFKGIRVRESGPAGQAPTLRQCLSHTAGFPGNDARRDNAEAPEQFRGSLADVVSRLAKEELLAEPGTRYAYSGLGYFVAGRVAEVVTGRPFPEVLRRYLLHPLGAREATFTPAPEMLEQIPVAYERTAEGFRPREGRPTGMAVSPGGGLVSTLDDVARLMLLHRDLGRVGERQLLAKEAIQGMYQPQPATPGAGYGLGFNIMQRRPDGSASRIRHTGASGTLAMLDFDRDLIVIVLTQVPQTQTQRWREQLLRTIGGVFDGDLNPN